MKIYYSRYLGYFQFFENMHKTFKVRYKENNVHIAISYCLHKLYSTLETGFVIKMVQMNLQSAMMLDYMSRSQMTVLGSFILT